MSLDFVAGCIGGAAGIFVGYPLDTVKVRIQAQGMSGITSGGSPPVYNSTFQCINSIIKAEGVKNLYRGLTSPLGGVALINAICFGVYGNVNRRLSKPDSVRSVAVAGAVSGFVQAFVCSPMELVKTQMQVGGCGTNGPMETTMKILKNAGIKGMCRGLGITICREVPAFGMYFSTYEYMVRGRQDNTALVFAAGGISGIISWVFTYPIDVIKTRIQADDVISQKAKYHGVIDCFRKSLKLENKRFLFRGIGSTVIRAFPVNATTMGVVTCIMRTMGMEEETTYDTMFRLRMADNFHLKLPPSIEEHFEQKRRRLSYRYKHNIYTMATDAPSIHHIGLPHLAINHNKVLVSNMLVAMPTRFQPKDPKDREIGTIRSNISFSVIERIFQRQFSLNLSWLISALDPQWSNEADILDNSLTNDKEVFLDESIIAAFEHSLKKDEATENIPTPSILATNQKIYERYITAKDLNDAMAMLRLGGERIYGVYYLT